MSDEMQTGLAAPANPTLAIIQQAIGSDKLDVETLERLQQMYEREEARRAEAAFHDAFAKFKAECPPVIKRTTDHYNKRVNREGVTVSRKYATLEDISAVVDPVLAKHGFSYKWNDPRISDDGVITITFKLSHRLGHSESTLSPPIPVEGGKAYEAISANRKPTSASPQQRMGVATTYAQRYSIVAGLGLTTVDDDYDGQPIGGTEQQGDTITEDQEHDLTDLCIQLADLRDQPHADAIAGVCKWRKISKLSELPASMLKPTLEKLAQWCAQEEASK